MNKAAMMMDISSKLGVRYLPSMFKMSYDEVFELHEAVEFFLVTHISPEELKAKQ
jgi:hypothetical protein